MHKNQKGFAHLELLLILVIVLAVGGVGYYVWHRNHTNKQATTSSETTTTANKQTASDSSNSKSAYEESLFSDQGTTTNNGKDAVYVNKTLGLTFTYPNDLGDKVRIDDFSSVNAKTGKSISISIVDYDKFEGNMVSKDFQPLGKVAGNPGFTEYDACGPKSIGSRSVVYHVYDSPKACVVVVGYDASEGTGDSPFYATYIEAKLNNANYAGAIFTGAPGAMDENTVAALKALDAKSYFAWYVAFAKSLNDYPAQ